MQDQPTIAQRRAVPQAVQARIALAMVLIACVAGGLWMLLRTGHAATAGAAPAAQNNTAVRLTAEQLAALSIAAVGTQPFQSQVQAEGEISVDADAATALSAPFSGHVERIAAAIGARVRAGTTLAAIRSPEFVQAQTDMLTAASQLVLARLNETRRHGAYQSRGGSLQDWQQSQADLETAQAALAAARNRLRVFGQSEQQIRRLEQTRSIEPLGLIVSPIDGVVTARNLGPGQFIQDGDSTPIYTVVNLSKVWLLAAVRAADAAAIQPGQSLEVELSALPGRSYRARVVAVAAEADPATHRVGVRAALANTDGQLRPGMFAAARIFTGAATIAAAVPQAAIVREGADSHVWVLQADDTLVMRPIQTGRVNGSMVEVLRGLAPGERIVTAGALFIDRAANPD